LNVLDAAEILSQEGPFAAVFESFESRSSQQEMAAAVARAMQDGGVALIEAGTGTGKSLAYLVPAALHALETGDKVVISTNTITLQEQLLNKDIPLVQKAFAPELKACLVKGWSNYLCRLRLDYALQDESASEQELTELQQLATWAANSSEGTLAEHQREPATWQKVYAESDTCARSQCPHFGECFFFRARARMDEAHLLVVNHYLLFADVAVRRAVGWDTERAVLPLYKYCILDEAHHIEQVASSYLSESLSEYGLHRLLQRIHHGARNQKPRGVLSLVSNRASASLLFNKEPELANDILALLEQQVYPMLNQLDEIGATLFNNVSTWLSQTKRAVSRIRSGQERTKWQETVKLHTDQLAEAAVELASMLRRVKKEAAPLLSEDPLVLYELDALAQRCVGWADLASHIGIADNDERVYWVDTSGYRGQVRALATPLQVGPIIKEWIDSLHTLVCTSATLSVAGSFSFIRQRLGVEDDDSVSELVISSPFRFREQALIAVPMDLPEPTAPTYPDALAQAVQEIILASQGRAFVLFTSYALLKQVAEYLAPVCEAEGWPLLVQGQDGRSHMLNTFKAETSVLLGTDSFWEGVDVPGEALSCVILTRLPFRVPDDPVTEARMEDMRKAGLDPFYNFSLPEAVLKFKQGFGRLIRSHTDHGAVVVCDKRILQRSYGRYFFASLPECTGVQGRLGEVISAVRDWL
jgi:ATP-dependent DNA helicase DinG